MLPMMGYKNSNYDLGILLVIWEKYGAILKIGYSELCDGRQIVITQSPELVSDSVSEGEVLPSTDSFLGDGPIISWADECNGVVDFAIVGMRSECEF